MRRTRKSNQSTYGSKHHAIVQICGFAKGEQDKRALELLVAKLVEAEFILRGSPGADKFSQHVNHMELAFKKEAERQA